MIQLKYEKGEVLMFRLFGKKPKLTKSPEEKRAEEMAINKKVQFEPMAPAELEQMLDADVRSVLKLNPVNYYATKNRYLLCTLYFEEDYSEVYMRFELRRDDLPAGKTKVYRIDRLLLRDILRRFGQNINFGEQT